MLPLICVVRTCNYLQKESLILISLNLSFFSLFPHNHLGYYSWNFSLGFVLLFIFVGGNVNGTPFSMKIPKPFQAHHEQFTSTIYKIKEHQC